MRNPQSHRQGKKIGRYRACPVVSAQPLCGASAGLSSRKNRRTGWGSRDVAIWRNPAGAVGGRVPASWFSAKTRGFPIWPCRGGVGSSWIGIVDQLRRGNLSKPGKENRAGLLDNACLHHLIDETAAICCIRSRLTEQTAICDIEVAEFIREDQRLHKGRPDGSISIANESLRNDETRPNLGIAELLDVGAAAKTCHDFHVHTRLQVLFSHLESPTPFDLVNSSGLVPSPPPLPLRLRRSNM